MPTLENMMQGKDPCRLAKLYDESIMLDRYYFSAQCTKLVWRRTYISGTDAKISAADEEKQN